MVAGVWAIAAAWFVVGIAASPLHTHHDVKKSYPSESVMDEEVRQLLDLKTLANQRDHKTNEGPNADLTPSPAAPDDNTAPGGGVREVGMEKTREETFKMADGVKEQHAHTDQRVTADGHVVQHTASELDRHQEPGKPQHARHQVDVDVPSQGMHKTLVDEDGHRSVFSRDHKSVVRYSPLDLALYVYKTGDEEGVTLAIQELIAEGLMTAEEALSYLHDIREHLHRLTLQDAQDKELPDEFKSLVKKNEMPVSLSDMGPDSMLGSDPDYDSVMERLRPTPQDYSYTQYSLEEVIYQLAKILFKQAMHREGDVGSERALQEVAGILEKEVARGAISPEVEKKVLDVMVNSLVDSLGENEFGVGPVIGGSNMRVPPNSEASYPMPGSSSMAGASYKQPSVDVYKPSGDIYKPSADMYKPSGDIFQLSKTTTKREAPTKKKDAHKNN